jgi:hypothetical protein
MIGYGFGYGIGIGIGIVSFGKSLLVVDCILWQIVFTSLYNGSFHTCEK